MAAGGKRSKKFAATTVPQKKGRMRDGKQIAPPQKTIPGNTKGKTKEKAFNRKFIPIPAAEASDDDEDTELLDQDLGVLQNASFLKNLDQKSIAKSKGEIKRLHQLHKPTRRRKETDGLPSLDSGDEWDGDDTAMSHFVEGDSQNLEETARFDDREDFSAVESDSDAEMPYEQIPRKRRPPWADEDVTRSKRIKGLPIKLPDGTIQKTDKVLLMSDSEQSSDQESECESKPQEPETREDVATGARFGRAAVVDIIAKRSRRERVEAAKEQIASICEEILAEPENSLGLVKRLHTFSLREISSPTQPKPIPNDPIIRKLSLLSQLAIFKDIIPGYRIRPLTDKEKAEKVSSIVARTREWEQGLVLVYQTYLRSLEIELKERTEFADIALYCMCTLLAEVTHFNFSANLISCIVTRLGRKSWDKSSELCIGTIIKVFREDLTGSASLEIVRVLSRTIRERQFAVHPNALSCLSYLRLRTELGVRASDTKIEKEGKNRHHRRGEKSDQPHLSKRAKKALKEKQGIEKELREAEAEVDKEERAAAQTETLKLLFALYFRILKNPRPTPLLSAALTGIAKFAHLINIDFFQDLVKALKQLISLEVYDSSDADEAVESAKHLKYTLHRLQCIVTAFDLLSGQGEALNIDLSDFITQLYGMILPLTLVDDIESPSRASQDHSTTHTGSAHTTLNKSSPNKQLPYFYPTSTKPIIPTTPSISDILFRALDTVFSPRAGVVAPPWRSAAFAKRLLAAALHWPPSSALRALQFVHSLIAKNPKLEALLSTEDRIFDGIYRPDVDDPQLCHPYGTAFWELQTLATSHMDPDVRDVAEKLLNFSSGAS